MKHTMVEKRSKQTAGKEKLNMQDVLSMRSSGYYSQRTAGAKNAIDSVLPLMKEALNNLPEMEVLRFADYGAADGGTSAELWSDLISSMRNGGDGRHTEILYTDLPSNDFSTLFKTMQGMGGDPSNAYQVNNDNVFVHGCGTGFHRQLMASDSLSLGFSATAMHYVSEKPCEIEDHVHMVGAAPDELAQFAQRAAEDWEKILLARAAEMKLGSQFIVLNFGIDEQGRYLGHTGGHSMFDKFTQHWRSLLNAEKITQKEFRKATFVQHYRTLGEFKAPFDNHETPVMKAGLRLKSARTQLTKCPYKKAFMESDGAMSAGQFATSLIPTMRSWSETVFLSALSSRPPAEAQAIVDEFYKSYEAEVAANPDGHAMDYIHAIMVIEKVA
jgi:hypothetical protein